MCKVLGLGTGDNEMNKTLFLSLSSFSHGGEWWLSEQLQYKEIMLLSVDAKLCGSTVERQLV